MSDLDQQNAERLAIHIEEFETNRHKWFVSEIAVLNSNGIKNSEIAEALGITPTHLSRIINQTKKVPETLANLLSAKFRLLRYSFISDESRREMVFIRGSDPIGEQNVIKKEIFYSEEEVEQIKQGFNKEINHLNSIIDHLRFIIDEYKRMEKK